MTDSIVSYHTINGKIRSMAYNTTSKMEYLHDGLGSVVRTTNDNSPGGLVRRYAAYDKVLSGGQYWTDVRFGWVGGYGYRQTSLPHAEQYVRARHYSTIDSRWTTRDSLWPDESAFGYVHGGLSSIIDQLGSSSTDQLYQAEHFVNYYASRRCNLRSSYFPQVDENRRPPLPSEASFLKNCCVAEKCFGFSAERIGAFANYNRESGNGDYKKCGAQFDSGCNYNAGFTACCMGLSFTTLTDWTGCYKSMVLRSHGKKQYPYPSIYHGNKPSGYCEMLYGYIDCIKNKVALDAICNNSHCEKHSLAGDPCPYLPPRSPVRGFNAYENNIDRCAKKYREENEFGRGSDLNTGTLNNSFARK